METLFGDYVIPRRKSSEPAEISSKDPCDSCKLQGHTVVNPKKSTVANPIMIIGLYPGWQEEKEGIVFVGESGTYLHEVLLKSGFTEEEIRDSIYETNIVQCRPTDGRGRQIQDLDDVVKACGAICSKTIDRIKPSLIIVCGELPVKYFLGKKYVGSVRGQVKIRKVLGNEYKFIATFNPAYISKKDESRGNDLDRERFEQDIRTAYEIWKNIPFDRKRDYQLIDSMDKLDSVLAQMYKADSVSVDFETSAPKALVKRVVEPSLDPYAEGFKIISVSLCCEPDKAYCLLLEHPDNPLQFSSVFPRLKSFLESQVPKEGQNIKFDYRIASVHWGIDIRNIVFDAMLASSLIDMRKDVHNLDRLAIDWLGERSYKFEMFNKLGDFMPEVGELVERNCKDADLVHRLRPVLTAKLKELDLYDYFMNWRILAITALGRAEVRGIPVDREYATKSVETMKKKFCDSRMKLWLSPKSNPFRILT